LSDCEWSGETYTKRSTACNSFGRLRTPTNTKKEAQLQRRKRFYPNCRWGDIGLSMRRVLVDDESWEKVVFYCIAAASKDFTRYLPEI
jgi:hypothetical protein